MDIYSAWRGLAQSQNKREHHLRSLSKEEGLRLRNERLKHGSVSPVYGELFRINKG